jgi:hypothetical protein
MDMGFARRNAAWTKGRTQTVDLASLLARLAARQASSPTARIQTRDSHNEKNLSNFCSQAARFAPVQGEAYGRLSASFCPPTVALITDRQ